MLLSHLAFFKTNIMHLRSLTFFLTAFVVLVYFVLSGAQAVNLHVGTGRALLSTPCHSYGGYCIGQQGAAGTIYANHVLSWADDFSGPLDIVGPTTPKGKYFTTKGYSVGPRGNNSSLGASFDSDPLYTGYNDSGRGVPIGYNNMTQSGGVLQLQARVATSGEQAGFYPTDPSINGGVRPLVSAGINSAGAVAVYPSTGATTIIEGQISYSASGPAGNHPTFWLFSSNPVIAYNSDEWDAPEQYSGGGNLASYNRNLWTNGSAVTTVGSNFGTMYDGNFHWSSAALVNGGNTVFYVDGSAQTTFSSTDSNSKSKPLYFLLTEHVLAVAYNAAAWAAAPNGASAFIKMVRVWVPINGTAKLWVPSSPSIVPDLKVDYAGSGTLTIPSAATVWGDSGVTEFLQVYPDEANEPGMTSATSFQTGGSTYCPSGLTCNLGARTITANFSATGGNAGVMHGLLYGYKTDGSAMVPARFTIYRGPNFAPANQFVAGGGAVSYDLRGACDVGIATLPTEISAVSGLPSGVSFSSGTESISGTVAASIFATVSATCTNNAGQSAIKTFYICSFSQQESCDLFNRFDAQPDAAHQGYVDAAIACFKTNSVWADFDVLSLALNDQANSLLNWKANANNASAVSSPSFTAYRGFTGNGTSSYVDVAYKIGISGTSAKDSAFASIYSLTSGQQTNAAGFAISGANGTTLNPRNSSDLLQFRMNDATASTIANTNGSGWITIDRDSSTTKEAYTRGAQLGSTVTASSTSAVNLDAGIGHALGAATYSTIQAFGWAFGPSHGGTDEAAIYGCAHNYAQDVGAETAPGLAMGSFNTAGVWADVGTHSAFGFDRTQAWTGIAWVKLAAAPALNGAAVLFTTANQGQGQTKYTTPLELWVDQNCHLRVRIISDFSSNNYLGAIGSQTFCDGVLHKVAASYDGSSTFAGISMSIDGATDINIINEGHSITASAVNRQPLTIGGQYGWPYNFGGTIEHLSISNVVRSQSWIQSYTTAAASVDTNTLLAYDFTENTGKTTADSSSNSFTGAVCNAVWQPSTMVGNAPCLPQGAASVDHGASALSSVSASLPANVASGSAIAGAVYCACLTTLTVTDDMSNSYTVLGPETSLTGVQYWQFYATNLTNSPHTVTATLSAGTGTFWRMEINEVANVISTVDGNALAYTAAASGTDGLSSGSITTMIDKDFIFGNGTSYDSKNLLAGTNFSMANNIFGTIDSLWSEYYWQPTAGSVAATFTPSATTRGHAGGIAFRTQ